MTNKESDRREFQDEKDAKKSPEWKNANRDEQRKEDAKRYDKFEEDKKKQQKND